MLTLFGLNELYFRYLKLLPKYREDFVDYLRKIDKLDDAAQQLAILVNDDKPYSEHGRTTHQVIFLFRFVCDFQFVYLPM